MPRSKIYGSEQFWHNTASPASIQQTSGGSLRPKMPQNTGKFRSISVNSRLTRWTLRSAQGATVQMADSSTCHSFNWTVEAPVLPATARRWVTDIETKILIGIRAQQAAPLPKIMRRNHPVLNRHGWYGG